MRDLLATLDLWCDLSEMVAAHLRRAEHAFGVRYGFVLTLPCPAGPCGRDDRHCGGCEQFVLGPVCAECVGLVGVRVAEWMAEYPLATGECVGWGDVAVLRGARWEARS